MKFIDAEKLIAGRVSNDPVVIAAKCAPAANVREIVHAVWKQHKHGGWYCSNCKMALKYGDITLVHAGVKFFKICPKCGAEMKKEKSK